MTEPTLVCPECGSDQVTVSEVHSIMVNTYEHYCYSVKAHDSDAKYWCLKCDWEGERKYLKEQTERKPVFTTGHCKEKAKAGGCQLHNLQCGYPACDRKLT